MNANELLYGIYVYFNYFDDSKITVKVTGFNDGIVYGVSEHGSLWCNISKVEPIPLTAERLEKIGFRKVNEERYLLEDLDDNYWVKFYPKDTNYTEGAYDYIDLNRGCISIREKPIEFVHELQHVLSICKINKTIEL